MHRRSLQLVLIVLIGSVIVFPFIGSTGLSSSEGHRVIPAIEMLESGDYLVPHMFEWPYVRKPQLVPWAFALSMSIYPDPAISPRVMSGLALLLTAIGSCVFARKWFGERAGLGAGLAVVLTPLLWSPARSAEIESIHNLFAALGAWITVAILTSTSKRPRLILCAGLVGVSFLMLITKGPAGFPVFLGLLIANAALRRSMWSMFNGWVWLPVALGSIVFGVLWSMTLREAGDSAVIQTPNAFMFEADRVLKLAGFVPVSLVTALPASLVLLFPWGKDARDEAHDSESHTHQLQIAKTIALGIVCGLIVMMLMGVSNDRYAQPILISMFPLAGWILTVPLQPHRSKIMRTMMLGSPKVMLTVLVVGGLVYIPLVEFKERSTSGHGPGTRLANECIEQLPSTSDPILVIADAMIEARPETLLSFRTTLDDMDRSVDIRWIPGLDSDAIAALQKSDQSGEAPAMYAIIRTDSNGDESDKLLIYKTLGTGRVHLFDFALVELKTK